MGLYTVIMCYRSRDECIFCIYVQISSRNTHTEKRERPDSQNRTFFVGGKREMVEPKMFFDLAYQPICCCIAIPSTYVTCAFCVPYVFAK